MRYDREDIRPGNFMELDAPMDAPLKMSTPRAPRYGDVQPFAEVAQKLDQARVRLEKLRADLRATRG